MRNLLNENTVRILNLIEHLYRNYPNNIAIKDIAKLNACSLKTVHDDLLAINKVNHFRIKPITKNNNVILAQENFSSRDIFMVKRDIVNADLNIRLLLDLFFNPNQRLLEYAKDHHYSPSTIRYYFNKLNEYLNQYGICVHRNSNNTYRLKTDHHWSIGLMIADLIRASGHEKYLENIELKANQPKGILSDYFSEYTPNTILMELETLSKIDTATKKLYPDYKKTSSHDELLTTFQKQQAVIEKDLCYFINDFNSDFQEENLCEIFINQATDIFKYCALKAKYNPTKFDNILNRYDNFVRDYENNHDNLATPLNDLVERMEKTLDVDFAAYTSEVKFHFYILVLPVLITARSGQKLTIAINSDFEALHTDYLLSLIKYYMPFHDYVKYEDNKKFDILVCTGSLNTEIDKNRVVLINDYLSFERIVELHKNIMVKARELNIIKTIEDYLTI